MKEGRSDPVWERVGLLYRSHPWHGIPIGEGAPERVTAYIEIVPTDTVKYELDKASGYLRVDRPQKFSNVYPTLYGFIPQTYCGPENGAFCAEKTGRPGIMGDGDPLDVCVLSEKSISHGDVIVEAIPIGGLRMLDGDEADDKIIAVLDGDAVYGSWREIYQSPPTLIERLKHYFLTYKQPPGSPNPRIEITDVYGREEAYEIIRRSRVDYDNRFAGLKELLATVLKS
jgi:inorganic pyrophosphatase